MTLETPNVLLIWVAEPTVSVPVIFVLPLSLSTVNLSTEDPFWILKFSLEASTIKESLIVVWPWTTKVPSVATLPEPFSIVNLSVVPDLTAKLLSISTVPLNSELPCTVSVLEAVISPPPDKPLPELIDTDEWSIFSFAT